ncbi:hypothetical protein C8F04DRAFT_664746 [Mycena alexandri]|uniref:Glutaminase A central domain-containing protein n=1 Tax=Mycena alexandri TaxID=1745969 RepID=A0AAD6SQP2_9AGAR|nr:hypothetical protein C8F04DRAFT_664746 [Mycena alexandri]
MADFPAARSRAIALDEQIVQAAAAVSPEYADLVSLAARQAMAGIEITLPPPADGSWNMSDVKAFMKDVGNTQRVNPTETIFAALPALMYLNASITGALLEPLLECQSSSGYTNSFAASDLGANYPTALGEFSSSPVFAVEDSGNMLILVWAHARSSGDGSLIGRYYTLLKEWADYLSTHALTLEQQSPADSREDSLGQTQTNITNLALKGIIAVRAMAEISRAKGEAEDALRYETTSKTLAQSWMNLTLSAGQLHWTYDESASYGLMYNLFPDKLLQLDLFPSTVYEAESASLSNHSTSLPPFGFPLSSDSSNTRSDWTLFSAAAAPDVATRDRLISTVHASASMNSTEGIFPNLYNVETGAGPGAGIYPNGYASPAQGALFSLLALNVPNKTVVIPPRMTPPRTVRKNTAAIVGGVMGTLGLMLLVAAATMFIRRRQRRRTIEHNMAAPQPYEAVPNMAQSSGEPSPSRKRSPPNPSQVTTAGDGLRGEVVRLRQDLEELRAIHEAPPVYE